ncbi:MAG: allophanate hydrolase subunit 1, partial [Bacteroidota bacterium]
MSAGVHAYAQAVAKHPAVVECVPAYASLLVRYAPPKTSAYALEEYIFSLRPQPLAEKAIFRHEIPVCYAPSLAPDLEQTAALLELTPEALIEFHTNRSYLVYQLGYLPGFAFMGQTAAQLAVARLNSPRARVPAGSVGLAGRQTGIYPLESPGGWRLIGRCPW